MFIFLFLCPECEGIFSQIFNMTTWLDSCRQNPQKFGRWLQEFLLLKLLHTQCQAVHQNDHTCSYQFMTSEISVLGQLIQSITHCACLSFPAPGASLSTGLHSLISLTSIRAPHDLVSSQRPFSKYLHTGHQVSIYEFAWGTFSQQHCHSSKTWAPSPSQRWLQ